MPDQMVPRDGATFFETQREADEVRLRRDTSDSMTPPVVPVTVFQTEDGKRFDTVEQAYMHVATERVVDIMRMAARETISGTADWSRSMRDMLQQMLQFEENRAAFREIIDRLEGRVV